jgi:hypothetical protein
MKPFDPALDTHQDHYNLDLEQVDKNLRQNQDNLQIQQETHYYH